MSNISTATARKRNARYTLYSCLQGHISACACCNPIVRGFNLQKALQRQILLCHPQQSHRTKQSQSWDQTLRLTGSTNIAMSAQPRTFVTRNALTC